MCEGKSISSIHLCVTTKLTTKPRLLVGSEVMSNTVKTDGAREKTASGVECGQMREDGPFRAIIGAQKR